MTNQIQSPNNKIFELEERTAKFGEEVIKFIRTIKLDNVSKPVMSQLIRSATSIGANYCEADGAESKKYFQLWKEAHELTLIFSKIINNSKLKK